MGTVGREKAKFVEVRRIYVNKYYELLRKEERGEEVYMICQDTGLDSVEYLELKKELKEKGGSLFKFMNQHSSFANLWELFGGGTFCIEWGGLEEFEKKKDFLEKRGCIVLCVLNGNKFHYSSDLVGLNEKVLDRSKRLVLTLKKEVKRLYKIKWRIYANLSSIKKASAKKD